MRVEIIDNFLQKTRLFKLIFARIYKLTDKMKKILILATFLLGTILTSSAQVSVPAIEVSEMAFTSNPASFAGKIIKIKNLSITLPEGPSANIQGSGKPCNPSNPAIMRIIKPEFSNPNFKACFEIETAKCNNIPKNLECIGNVIIKVGGPGMNHNIIDCKVQP